MHNIPRNELSSRKNFYKRHVADVLLLRGGIPMRLIALSFVGLMACTRDITRSAFGRFSRWAGTSSTPRIAQYFQKGTIVRKKLKPHTVLSPSKAILCSKLSPQSSASWECSSLALPVNPRPAESLPPRPTYASVFPTAQHPRPESVTLPHGTHPRRNTPWRCSS
jgi:hypothetical protein